MSKPLPTAEPLAFRQALISAAILGLMLGFFGGLVLFSNG